MSTVKRSRGGTQPDPLSREDIVEVALPILARDGIDGLTMRSVADALGVSAPAIHHHVGGRETLLDHLCERVATEVDLDVPAEATWDDAITTIILNMHDVFGRYPGVAARVLPARRPSRAADQMSRVVHDHIIAAGYAPDDADELLAALRVVVGGWLLGRRRDLPARTAEPALLERMVRWTIAGFAADHGRAHGDAADHSRADGRASSAPTRR